MSVALTSIICSCILSITSFFIIKEISDSKVRLLNLKNILAILILSIIETIFYTEKYTILYIICNYFLIVLFTKFVFKYNMCKTIIITSILIIVLMFADFIDSFIMINVVSFENVRSCWYLRIINHFLVAIFSWLIISFPMLQKKCKYYISKFSDRQIPTITLFIISITVIAFITYNMAINFKWNIDYIVNLLVILSLMLFCYFFINENNQFNILNAQYDSLFKCIQTFEEWIEKEQLNRHEYKNQLAVLRYITSEQEVKDKIDSIISENINIDNTTVSQLKNIPNGGIKGLLYYKFIVAQNYRINISIDCTIKRKTQFKKYNEDEMKIICRVLGIYLDNAIEAAKETKKKIVYVEIYEYNNIINIVISNTYDKKKDISKRNEKGFSTKGEGRGNGLYFARKLIEKCSLIDEEQTINGEFYIQKVKIKSKFK